MRPGIDDDTFDRDMRQRHATAMTHLSPQTLARLRDARHSAQAKPVRGHAWRWATATAFSAVLAVVLGTQLLPQRAGPAVQPVASPLGEDGYTDALATLDESPDLYMWLASPEAETLAME